MFEFERALEFLRRLKAPRRKMKLVLVCGAWGGGTSAVAGLMANLGAQGFGPYHRTNEPRTPVSFEFIPFRNTILQVASEETLALKPDAAMTARIGLNRLHRNIVQQKYGTHDPDGPIPILFKYPLSALLMPEICEVFDTRLIYVRRPLEDIERSRARRQWPVEYGREGAKVIYRAMDDFEQLQSHPIFTVHYADFWPLRRRMLATLRALPTLNQDRPCFSSPSILSGQMRNRLCLRAQARDTWLPILLGADGQARHSRDPPIFYTQKFSSVRRTGTILPSMSLHNMRCSVSTMQLRGIGLFPFFLCIKDR
jgi:hypothetical protein